MFLDDAAQEDSDEELEARDAEAVRYDAKDLERQNKGLDINEMEQRYIQQDQEEQEYDYSEGGENEMQIEAAVVEQSLLPSTRDAKLWQVRVKKNFEKVAVMALLNKSMDFARRGQPLSILSVTSSDSTEGYIYIEAFKEIHVKEACANLHFILNQYTLLPTDQMTSVY